MVFMHRNLYFDSILVGCSLYMLTQLIRLIIDWSRTGWSEILCLVGAGISGGFSLLLIRMDFCWLCKTFGPWSIEVRASCMSSGVLAIVKRCQMENWEVPCDETVALKVWCWISAGNIIVYTAHSARSLMPPHKIAFGRVSPNPSFLQGSCQSMTEH